MRWPDNPGNPPDSDSWARVTISHLSGSQANLSPNKGRRRYTRSGVVSVQVFTPAHDGLKDSDEYVSIFSEALEGASTPGGVWFRNVSTNEVGNDGPWFRVDVTAIFEYTQFS